MDICICDRELDQLLLAASVSRRGCSTCEVAISFPDHRAPSALGLGGTGRILDGRQPEHSIQLARALADDEFAVPLQRCQLPNGAEGWELCLTTASPDGAVTFSQHAETSMRLCLPAFAVGNVVLRKGRTTSEDRFVALLDGDSEEAAPAFRSCSQAVGYLALYAPARGMTPEARTAAVLKARRHFAALVLEQTNACLAGDVWGFEYHAYHRATSGWRRIEFMEDAGFFGRRALLAAVDACFAMEAGRHG